MIQIKPCDGTMRKQHSDVTSCLVSDNFLLGPKDLKTGDGTNLLLLLLPLLPLLLRARRCLQQQQRQQQVIGGSAGG